MFSRCVCLAVFLSLGWPSLVWGLSCVPEAFSQRRDYAIRETYCSSEDVYFGKVLRATCSCVTESSSLRCQRYDLDVDNSIISTSLLAVGTCENSFLTPALQQCSSLGNSLVSWGLRVESPSESTGDVPMLNLTYGRSCNLSCSFNSVIDAGQYYPCIYSLRVEEVFKGNYSTGDVIEVIGPEVGITAHDRVLQVNTDYLAGIGGLCNVIMEWSTVSTFSSSELNIIRQNITCSQTSVLPSLTAGLVTLSLLLVLT